VNHSTSSAPVDPNGRAHMSLLMIAKGSRESNKTKQTTTGIRYRSAIPPSGELHGRNLLWVKQANLGKTLCQQRRGERTYDFVQTPSSRDETALTGSTGGKIAVAFPRGLTHFPD